MTQVVETPVVPPPAPQDRNGHHAASQAEPGRSRGGRIWKLFAFVLILFGGALAAKYLGYTPADGVEIAKKLVGEVVGETKHVEPDVQPSGPARPWDGTLHVTEGQQTTVGFRIVDVKEQKDALQLELNATTDYDQNSLSKIRPRFDTVVQRVFASTGQAVKKGDPLIELYSTELAAAKNECRTKFVQWDHDRKLMEARRPLAAEGRITQILWVDTKNDEKKSRLEYLQARDKLVVFKMSSEEIDKLLAGLGDEHSAIDSNSNDDVNDISRMILKSPIDGIVVERDAVPGTFYDGAYVLMVVSPMDHLWVWGNVFENDQGQVRLGQKCRIMFPFLKEEVEGSVESIANRVDPVTHTLRIRMSVPNPGKNLKSDMLVRAVLQVPHESGQTSIPRNALVTINGEYFAYIQKPHDKESFERRPVVVDQENADTVVLHPYKKESDRAVGLKVGEKVVTNGSLLLSQLYEDESTVASGLPFK